MKYKKGDRIMENLNPNHDSVFLRNGWTIVVETEETIEEAVTEYSRKQLFAKAKEKGLKNYAKLSNGALIKLINESE